MAVLLPNGVEFIECFYGSARMGAIVVLLNWRLVADEFGPLVQELHQRGTTQVKRWLQVGTSAECTAFAVRYEELVAASLSTAPCHRGRW